jgi:hypothetical protein
VTGPAAAPRARSAQDAGVRPDPGQVLHFSEDPTITEFVPRGEHVWAVDAVRAPAYWFPPDCPRVLTWATPGSTAADRAALLPAGATRVHAIEHDWLDRVSAVRLFAYRLPAGPFTAVGHPEPHAFVASEPVTPLGPPEPVGDVLVRHADAGIPLRVLPRLDGFWGDVRASTLGFSGIRLRPAR